MRAIVAALGLAASLVACTFPEKQLHGKDPPFGCLGQPLPTTADPQVTLSGTVVNSFSQDPIAGASVEAHLLQPDALIFTVATGGDGRFSQNQATASTPRSAYFRATPAGFVETRFYPRVPIATSTDVAIQALTMTDLGTIAGLAAITIDPTKASLIVTAVDCNGDNLEGATITTNPAGTTLYFANGQPSTTAVATDSVTGSAIIANLPISNTTISASVGGMTLRSHAFDTAPGVLSQTEIQP